MRLEPVFIANDNSDPNQCLIACTAMAATSLGRQMSLVEACSLVGYEAGRWPWFVQAAQALSSYIPGVRLVSAFDYDAFLKRGVDYLKEQWPPHKLAVQEQHASPGFESERDAVRGFISSGGQIGTALDPASFADALNSNLAITLVDAVQLQGQSGYSGHAVLVYGTSNASNFYFLHDPGPPSKRTLRLAADMFLKGRDGGEAILIPHAGIPFGHAFNANDLFYCGSNLLFKRCHRPSFE